MEFTRGQVFDMEKIFQNFKKTKFQKNTDPQSEYTEPIQRATEEISTLRSCLEHLCDTDAVESLIYRLKAAELDLNRHIKTAKKLNN